MKSSFRDFDQKYVFAAKEAYSNEKDYVRWPTRAIGLSFLEEVSYKKEFRHVGSLNFQRLTISSAETLRSLDTSVTSAEDCFALTRALERTTQLETLSIRITLLLKPEDLSSLGVSLRSCAATLRSLSVVFGRLDHLQKWHESYFIPISEFSSTVSPFALLFSSYSPLTYGQDTHERNSSYRFKLHKLELRNLAIPRDTFDSVFDPATLRELYLCGRVQSETWNILRTSA